MNLNEKIKEALVNNKEVQRLYREHQGLVQALNIAECSEYHLVIPTLEDEKIKTEKRFIKAVEKVKAEFQTPSNLTLDISRVGQIRA